MFYIKRYASVDTGFARAYLCARFWRKAPIQMDIFLQRTDGCFIWVATTDTLASAREKVVQNPASSDYAFLIVDSTMGQTTLIEPSERPPERTDSSLVR